MLGIALVVPWFCLVLPADYLVVCLYGPCLILLWLCKFTSTDYYNIMLAILSLDVYWCCVCIIFGLFCLFVWFLCVLTSAFFLVFVSNWRGAGVLGSV